MTKTLLVVGLDGVSFDVLNPQIEMGNVKTRQACSPEAPEPTSKPHSLLSRVLNSLR